MKTPLHLRKGYEQEDPGFFICDADGLVLLSSDVMPDENALYRIIVCVNACEHIGTDWLESRLGHQSETTFSDVLADIRRQHEHAMKAIKEIDKLTGNNLAIQAIVNRFKFGG